MRRTIATWDNHGNRVNLHKEPSRRGTPQIIKHKDHYVEVSPEKRMRIGGKIDERELAKRFGLAPLGEIKERAQDAKKAPFRIDEETKKLHGYMKRHGVNWNLIEKRIPQYLPEKRRG